MEAAFAPMMEALRARGYGRGELGTLHVQRLGVSYVLHRKAHDGDRWKIAVTVIHDPDRAVRPG